jgi:4-aminobutyrate aminotransferase-like enzyme
MVEKGTSFRDLSSPKIVSELPGPKVSQFINQAGAIFPRYFQPIMDEADGIFIKDPDGNIFVDFISGRCVVNIGYSHPDFVRALQEQVSRGTNGLTENILKLIYRINNVTPGSFEKAVICGLSGSEMNDVAIKLARRFTRRPDIITFAGSYHGVSYGALSLTSYKQEMIKGFGPKLPGVHNMFYPYCYRCPFKMDPSDCGSACLSLMLDHAFKSYVVPEEVAAMVVEPVQGDAGWHVPPDDWLPRLREICDEHGILLVAEEIQTGFGRTGKWFGFDHYNVVPDITLLGKSIGCGVPNAATVVRADLFNRVEPFDLIFLMNTFSYNPLACVATLTNLDIIEKEKLVERSAEMGTYMHSWLKDMVEDHKILGDVRGKGLMMGVEVVEDKGNKKPGVNEADRIVEEAFKRGLYMIQMGAFDTAVLRIAPPFIINKDQLDSCLEILDDSISRVEKTGL